MTWEGVPWMVDGAEHTAEVGRLLAYAASGSNEGVIGIQDCAVVPSAIPDSNVHILSGAISALNRFPGGGQQSYMLRNVGDEVVALTPQGSSGVRYDLVAVIVEDPQYPGQPAPASVTDGPYLRSAVYEDVDPATRHLYEVDPDQTGYALALVKFDASDGTVTAADITDLRELLNPRTKTFKRLFNEVDQANDGSVAPYKMPTVLTNWPPNASWTVEVPSWATKMQISGRVANLRVVDNDFADNLSVSYGIARIELGTVLTANTEWMTSWNHSGPWFAATQMSYEIADTKDVPEAMQGTLQTVKLMANATYSNDHVIGAGWGTTVVVEVTFYEEPGLGS